MALIMTGIGVYLRMPRNAYSIGREEFTSNGNDLYDSDVGESYVDILGTLVLLDFGLTESWQIFKRRW